MTEAGPAATSNWGRWGEQDERGTANLLDGETVLEALRVPARGKVYDLGIELRHDAPVAGPRIPPLHLMRSDGGDYAALGREDWGTADDYLVLATGGTTHLDGLSHMWRGGTMYNGFSYKEVRSTGAARCGMEKVGGLVTTAHVLDFTQRETAEPGVIATGDLDAWFADHGAEPRPGDAVLVRTGWMEAALRGELGERPFPVVGPETGDWFARHDIALVGADNQAVEEEGRRGVLPPLHGVLLRDLGVYLLEMMDLSGPGADGVTRGLLVVAPLRITRGVNSPVNPLLIV